MGIIQVIIDKTLLNLSKKNLSANPKSALQRVRPLLWRILDFGRGGWSLDLGGSAGLSKRKTASGAGFKQNFFIFHAFFY